MARFSEDTLNKWRMPPSDHEESKLANAERLVKEALREDGIVSQLETKVFGQGSYANDTNVRLNSDIDINVQYQGVFYFNLPDGKRREDFDLNSPSGYKFIEFKNSVENALVKKFGRQSVIRNDKCITISEANDRIETDVVPTFRYKRFALNGSYVEGAKFKTDGGKYIVNFPLQHTENGVGKNATTHKRFKRLTRIFRKIRYKMMEDGISVNDNITSFLVECLVWNIPDPIFNDNNTWTDRLRASIVFLWQNTKADDTCTEWGEVSELLYLFRPSRKWTRSEVNMYLVQMWSYLEY